MDKQKRRLTKKQFIIGIAAICGIVLVIEGALLIHTFSGKNKNDKGKKGDPAKTEESAKTTGGYSMTRYDYIDGERKVVYKETYEKDSEGRTTHYSRWSDNKNYVHLAGEKEETYDAVYTYDDQGRLLSEITGYVGSKDPQLRERIRHVYEYPDSYTTVETVYDENDEVILVKETKYNERGALLSKTETRANGDVWSRQEREYDSFGNLVSKIDERKNEKDVYEEAQRKVLRYVGNELRYADYYDEQGRLIRREEYDTEDGEPRSLGWLELEYEGDNRIVRKTIRHNENGDKDTEREFDREGRVIGIRYVHFAEEEYEWDGRHPDFPEKEIMKRTVRDSQTGKVTEEHFYFVERKDNESETPGDPSDYNYSQSYSFSTWIRTEITEFWLKEYSEKAYYEDGDSMQLLEAVFDTTGNIVSTTEYVRIWDGSVGEYRRLEHEYKEYDNHGNLIKNVQKNKDGEILYQTEYEYTYFD